MVACKRLTHENPRTIGVGWGTEACAGPCSPDNLYACGVDLPSNLCSLIHQTNVSGNEHG